MCLTCFPQINQWRNFFNGNAFGAWQLWGPSVQFIKFQCFRNCFKLFYNLAACFFLEKKPKRNPNFRCGTAPYCNFGVEKSHQFTSLVFIVTNCAFSIIDSRYFPFMLYYQYAPFKIKFESSWQLFYEGLEEEEIPYMTSQGSHIL